MLNPKVYHHNKISSLDPILSPLHNFTHCFFKTHFTTTLPSATYLPPKIHLCCCTNMFILAFCFKRINFKFQVFPHLFLKFSLILSLPSFKLFPFIVSGSATAATQHVSRYPFIILQYV